LILQGLIVNESG
jgi:hypothetical protein